MFSNFCFIFSKKRNVYPQRLNTCFASTSLPASGVQKSGDARGNCLIVSRLPNSSVEQWRIVVIVAGYTLFVTSNYDATFTFEN